MWLQKSIWQVGDIIKLFKETRTTIYNKNTKNNIKILFFSDIHYSGIKDVNKLNYLYNNISNISANYICISGDVIDNNKVLDDEVNIRVFINWLKKVSSNKKVLVSIGNHDQYLVKRHRVSKCFNQKFWDRLNNIDNVYILDNDSYCDKDICFVGYTQSFDYYYKYGREDETTMISEIKEHSIDSTDGNKLNVLLMHSPMISRNDKIKELLKGYDLILCGHMHNGMVLPVIDEIFDNNVGIIAPNKELFPKVARGIVDDNNVTIISSGITKMPRMASPFVRWVNALFPIGINIIEVTSKKCKLTKSHKYYK